MFALDHLYKRIFVIRLLLDVFFFYIFYISFSIYIDYNCCFLLGRLWLLYHALYNMKMIMSTFPGLVIYKFYKEATNI